MATVRFSERLRSEILNNASNIFHDRIRAAREGPNMDGWAARIYDAAFGQYKTHIDALPNEFFSMDDDFRFDGFRNTPDDWPENASYVVRLDLPENRVVVNLDNVPGFYKADFSSYGGVALDYNNTQFTDIRDAWKAWREGVNTIEREKRIFHDGVAKVITAHSTLAPALKAWPALWDLVPEHVKARHREIVTRTRREVDVEGVNLDSMTAAVTLDKLTK